MLELEVIVMSELDSAHKVWKEYEGLSNVSIEYDYVEMRPWEINEEPVLRKIMCYVDTYGDPDKIINEVYKNHTTYEISFGFEEPIIYHIKYAISKPLYSCKCPVCYYMCDSGIAVLP